jgi:hypothetical protein
MRERTRDERPASPAGGGGPIGQSQFREATQRLLARGGDLIDRALSDDSEEFLAANEQEGGQ